MNVAGARFYSTYQGYRHQEGHKGEHGNVISMFVDDMAQGDRPVVYEDGTQTRNFTHVDDVVAGLRAMAGENDEYNVCTDSPNTFNEVVNAINRALGTDIEAKYVEPQLEGEYIRIQEGDSSKLQSETGWEPSVSLIDGIERVCGPYQ
jgi:UDP-glucose 4-epimerase